MYLTSTNLMKTSDALVRCVVEAGKAVQDNGVRQQLIKTIRGRGYQFWDDIFVGRCYEEEEAPDFWSCDVVIPYAVCAMIDRPLAFLLMVGLCGHPGQIIGFHHLFS